MSTCLAQARHDANWVFGKNAGLTFIDSVSNPVVFYSIANSSELNPCVSDIEGDLLFFPRWDSLSIFNFGKVNLYNNKKEIIINGLDIDMFETGSSGGLVIPINSNTREYVLLTNIANGTSCLSNVCGVSYSVINSNQEEKLFVEKKNVLIEINPHEKLCAVKHADGISWLMYVIESNSSTPCTNKFYCIKNIEDSLYIYNEQLIGTNYCGGVGFMAGELVFSPDGNILANVIFENNKVDLFSVNRCTGELELITTIENIIKPYGIEFSPSGKYLYISSGFPLSSNPSYLYQVDLSASNINASVQLIYTHHSALVLGQLQRAPNGKIYGAWGGGLGPNFAPDSAISSSRRTTHYLAVINNPDSAGLNCDFQVRGLFLGDSASTTLGLPNFPNYRLGALSIYEADAGRDTVLCIDSTINQKVVQLGSPKVGGVQYQWYPNYNLSSDTVAQPLAYPDSSTMYYLMLSDTTITNACKTRLDSVYVEVRKCITSAHGQLSTVYSVKVFPNPASSEIKIESEWYKITHVAIHDVAGKALLSPFEGGACSHCVQAGDEVIINIKELSQGIYFIRTQLANGQTTINKLVKQ